jgi:2-iminobutanoate/2-iminopropanoate deaminase
VTRKHIAVTSALPPGMKGKPFSDAVRVGDTLYVGGRIGLDPNTGLPPPDAADEARCLMEDLRDVLGAAGMTMHQLVSVTVFSPDASYFETFNEVYLGYLDANRLPARAFIGSGALLFGARFELTAVAVGGQ